jgi:hypothetical protein
MNGPLPAAQFCSGIGQFHSPNNTRNPQPYQTTTLDEIEAMALNPPCVEKPAAQWAILSTLPSRVHAEQRVHGQFWAACADIDKNPMGFDRCVATVQLLFPATKFIAYTTRSATFENQKCRIIILLAGLSPGTRYPTLQKILNDRLEQAGITPDRATERVAQVCYLPNQGDYYQYHIEPGRPLDWQTDFAAELAAEQSRQEAAERALAERREQARLKAAERMATGTLSPIDAYNQAFTIEDCLLEYGYQDCGNRWLSPNSESGNPGVIVRDGKWFSSHESDRATVGAFGDAFDLFANYEHNGDRIAALKSAGAKFTVGGVSLTTANQRSYMEKQAEGRAAEIFGQAPAPTPEPAAAGLATNGASSSANKFQLVPAHTLKTNKPLEWQIEGIMELCAFCLMFGDSGTMKSFLALDMALCVATGVPFHGRKVNRGPVVIVVGEGLNGYGRRIAAWEKFHGIDLTGHPVFVSTMAAQFLDDSSAAEVEAAINSVSAKHGRVALVVLDTLNRNFGAGDENSTLDMTRFISAIDQRIGNGVTRLIVHHTGHANKERARGAYALKAALDCEIQVMKNDGKISMFNTKQKDAPEFSPIMFEPRVVELDSDGKITSLVLEKSDGVPLGRSVSLSPQMGMALLLLDLMNRKTGISCLTNWMHLCGDEGVYAKAAFYNASKTMNEKKIITISDGYVRRS